MEALAFAALLGVGYVFKTLTGQTKAESEGFASGSVADVVRSQTTSKSHIQEPAPAPDMSEIDETYQIANSSSMLLPLQDSVTRVSAPLAYGSSVAMNAPGVEQPPVYNKAPFVSQLSGQTFGSGEFKHQNMVPFFKGGGTKQNQRDSTNGAVLDLYTGSGSGVPHQEKREQVPLFNTAVPYGNVNGMPSISTFEQDRMVGSQMRQGERPFEPTYVGPGLGMGYSAEGTGGFQQAYGEEAARMGYKDVNALRPGNRPKITGMTPQVTPAKAIVTNRGQQASVDQHRPISWINNESGALNGAAVAAVRREAGRPTQVLMNTTRPETTVDYTGTAGPASSVATYTTGSYRDAHTIQHGALPYMPADASYQGTHDTDAENADYGRAGVELLPNERDATSERTHLMAPTVQVKARQAGLDAPRDTRKQEFIDNPQESGYLGVAMPSRATVYDPNDAPKTTIKETNIHDVRTGGIGGMVSKQTSYDPTDVARRTVKETNIDNTQSGTIGGLVARSSVYDPVTGMARVTIKQTTIDNDYTRNTGAGVTRGMVYDPSDSARTTTRQTTADNTYVGNSVTGVYRMTVYDPKDVARTTVRQTTGDDGHIGIVSGGPKRLTVYDPADVLKQTLRNTMTDVDPWLNTAPADGQTAQTMRYEDDIRPTQKSQLSNNEYTGIAGSADVAAARSQEAERNMKTNATKEKIARGRTPTRTGVKLMAGKDTVRVARPRHEEHAITRAPAQTKVSVVAADLGTVRKRAEVCQPNLFTPDIVSALASNPYATSVVGGF